MDESAFVAALLADTTVSGLVAGRIYPLVRKQGTLPPAVTYQRVGTMPETSLNGDADLDLVRLRVSTWGATYAQAKALARAVRVALGVQATVDMSLDDYDEESREFRVITDYKFWQDN